MGVFNFHKKEQTSTAPAEQTRRPSVHDVESRAAARWFAEGNAEPKKPKHISGFEMERARRASLKHEAINMQNAM